MTSTPCRALARTHGRQRILASSSVTRNRYATPDRAGIVFGATSIAELGARFSFDRTGHTEITSRDGLLRWRLQHAGVSVTQTSWPRLRPRPSIPGAVLEQGTTGPHRELLFDAQPLEHTRAYEQRLVDVQSGGLPASSAETLPSVPSLRGQRDATHAPYGSGSQCARSTASSPSKRFKYVRERRYKGWCIMPELRSSSRRFASPGERDLTVRSRRRGVGDSS